VVGSVFQLISGSEGDNSGITIPALAKANINTDIVHPAEKEYTSENTFKTLITSPFHELIN